MREQITAIVEELQRLKREGVTSVTVSEESLQKLRAAIRENPSSDVGPVNLAGRVEEAPASPSPHAGSSGREAASGFGAMLAAVSRRQPEVDTSSAKSRSKTGVSGKLPPPPVVNFPEGSKRERWEWLRKRVLECPVCQQHTHGDCQVVFGVGNIDADIFFCGEAPGAEEEVQGEPFVGPAGRLLTKMIVGMGLQREDVYIGNILNWRPEMEARASGRAVRQTGNRPPTEEEMQFGLPYLRAQVEVVAPKVIVALGSTAAAGLLGSGSFKSLGSIRGRWHTFNGTPLMVTYHPSYLLRNASNRSKRIVWEDLLQVMERVGLPISEKQRGYFL